MIINLISSPRNISTALMYSFAQRADTQVVDEPFYAYYLNHTGVDHPGSNTILESQPTFAENVVEQIQQLGEKNEYVFVKNMAHHLIGLDTSFLSNWKNVFLIRNPSDLITSFAKVISKPMTNDIGLLRQLELYQELSASQVCPIIDSENILNNADLALSKLCESVGINFDPAMLSWKPGAIKEDGVWAKYWYANVHSSSGFHKNNKDSSPFPKQCLDLLHESEKYYEIMLKDSLKF